MARKRVNKKFLVGLVSIFGVLVLGLLFAGMWYKDSPERAVRRATEADERGDREEAAEQWNKAYQRTGDPEYMMKAIDTALSDTTGPDGPEWIGRAMGSYQALLAANAEYMPARRELLELLASNRLFNVGFMTGVTREVREVAQGILERDANDKTARGLHAIATLNLSQFRGSGVSEEEKVEALETLETMAVSDPGDGRVILALTQHRAEEAGKVFRAEGTVAPVVEVFKTAYATLRKAEPIVGAPPQEAKFEEALPSYNLGASYHVLAGLRSAIDAQLKEASTEGAVELDEAASVEALRLKAVSHVENAVAATDAERDGLKHEYLRIHAIYAEALSSAGQAEASLEVLQQLHEVRPWDAQAAAILATALLRQGKTSEAEAVTQAALERQTEPLPPIGGTDGTEATLAQFVTKPAFVDVLLTRHEQEKSKDKDHEDKDVKKEKALLEEAKRVFASYESERATRRASVTPQALRIEGQFRLAEGDRAEAIAKFEEAIRMLGDVRSSDGARLLALAGQSHLALNQLGEAREAFARLHQISPDSALANQQLARILIRMGEPEAAQPYIDKLFEIDPQSSDYQRLAMAATPADDRGERLADMPEETFEQRVSKFNAANQARNLAEALRLGQLILAERPDDGDLKIAVAGLLHATGEQEEALAMIRPLAEAGNEQAERLRVQWEEGVEGLEGRDRLLAEASQALRVNDRKKAIEKLEEVFDPDAEEADIENLRVADRLFQLYLLDELYDKAEEMEAALSGSNFDRLDGRSYRVRRLIATSNPAAVEEARKLAQDYRTVAKAQAIYGQALAASGQINEAQEPLRQALDMAPTDVTTIEMLAEIQSRLGRVNEVKTLLEHGLRVSPGNATLTGRLRAWELQYGDAESVLTEFRKAVSDQRDSAAIHRQLINVLRMATNGAAATGRPEDVTRYSNEAVAAAIAAHQKFPADPSFLGELSVSAIRADEASRARATTQITAAVADGGPLADDLQAKVVAADHLARVGQTTQSETMLRSLLSHRDLTADQRAGVLLGLSQLASRAGREDEALALLSGHEDVPAVLERKAQLLGRRFLQDRSEAAYQALAQATSKAIEEEKLGPEGLNVVAIVELQRENYERAGELLETSRRMNPRVARTYALEAAMLTQKPKPESEAALAKLEYASNLDDGRNDVELLSQLARLQSSLGQRGNAAETLRRLLTVNPQDVGARLGLIELLLAERPPRYSDAAAEFRAAAEAGAGDHHMLLNARAWMELRRGQRQQAIQTGRQAVSAAAGTPQEAELFIGYFNLLHEAAAHQEVLKTIDERPLPEGGHPFWMLRARGRALAALNRDEEAVAAYTEAFSKAPAGQDLVVLRDMGQQVGFDAAWSLLQPRVEPHDGSTPTAADLNAAALLLVDAGRREEALQRLTEALAQVGLDDVERRSALQLHIGTLNLQAQPPRYEEAATAFREVLKEQPDNLGALNNLAYALTLQAETSRVTEQRRTMLDEAVEVARKAYDQSIEASGENRPIPSVTDTYAGAIAARARISNDQAALREAERLLRQARQAAEANNSPFPEVYLHLGQVQRDLGNNVEAAATATAGIDLLESRRASGEEVDETAARALQDLLSEVSVEAAASDAPAGRPN